MTMMDSRVADRRRNVSEDRARRRLRWLLGVLALLLAVVGGFWLIRSPVLSIRTVEVTGAANSNPGAVVAGIGLGEGTPTIDVSAAEIEAAVEADPWVADASVSVIWPGTIVIDVVEHVPVAPVQSGGDWVLMSRTGAVIAVTDAPDDEVAAVTIDIGRDRVGEVVDDPAIVGALEFVNGLTPELRAGSRVSIEDGGVVAVVSEHRVRLGRPIDMAEKAVVLAGLLASGLDDGAAIDLIAPSRPAVSNPEPVVEAEE